LEAWRNGSRVDGRWLRFVSLIPAWRSLAALDYHALGDTGAARELASEDTELPRASGTPRTLGRALRILGLIEGGAKASSGWLLIKGVVRGSGG